MRATLLILFAAGLAACNSTPPAAPVPPAEQAPLAVGEPLRQVPAASAGFAAGPVARPRSFTPDNPLVPRDLAAPPLSPPPLDNRSTETAIDDLEGRVDENRFGRPGDCLAGSGTFTVTGCLPN